MQLGKVVTAGIWPKGRGPAQWALNEAGDAGDALDL